MASQLGNAIAALKARLTLQALAFLLGILLVAICMAEGSKAFDRRAQTSHPSSARSVVTPVEGPSWLNHLRLRVSQTKLGEMGGGGSIPSSRRSEPEVSNGAAFVLGGADLYRINCRACHGPLGTGAPPEINSLIGPVQGMSPTLIRQRMKARGVEVDDPIVREMAAQAEAAIRQRLEKGGQEMPAFKYLRSDEVNSLLSYLENLADVPESRRAELLVHEPAVRVGEHLVKGTCHICHDATGPGGGHMAMMWGTIPSLASVPQERSLSSVIQVVQYGPRRMMMMMRGDRMPALPYLTEEEIAAAYFYLQKYPPR